MSQSPRKATWLRNFDLAVEDSIPTCCILVQISKLGKTDGEESSANELLSTAKEMRQAQASDGMCHNLKEVLKNDEAHAVNEHELLCRRAPTDKEKQIIVPTKYGGAALYYEHCPILAGHPRPGKMYDLL